MTVLNTPPTRKDGTSHGFVIPLYGGRLAKLDVPIPLSKQNLERLKRMLEDQLEPFLDGDDPEAT